MIDEQIRCLQHRRGARLFAGALGGTWLLPAIARADILPDPSGPEWDHTPLPMPEDEVWLAVSLLVLVGCLAVFVLRRRAAAKRSKDPKLAAALAATRAVAPR